MSSQLSDLRNIYSEAMEDYQSNGTGPYQGREMNNGSSLRFSLAHHGAVPELSREHLLEALPPKPMSDGLVKRFFDNDDPAIPVTCK